MRKQGFWHTVKKDGTIETKIIEIDQSNVEEKMNKIRQSDAYKKAYKYMLERYMLGKV